MPIKSSILDKVGIKSGKFLIAIVMLFITYHAYKLCQTKINTFYMSFWKAHSQEFLQILGLILRTYSKYRGKKIY